MTLTKRCMDHYNQLQFEKHKTNSYCWEISEIISRFSKSDGSAPKSYSVSLKIPPNETVQNIVIYCTCKIGAHTLDGCAHVIAVFYFLMIELPSNNHKIGNYAVSLSKSDIITNLRSFKLQKIAEEKQRNLSISS